MLYQLPPAAVVVVPAPANRDQFPGSTCPGSSCPDNARPKANRGSGRISHHAVGALVARNTITVNVVIGQQVYDSQLDVPVWDNSEPLTLVLPDDRQPCGPKIEAYVADEFPGHSLLNWWTPGEFNEFTEF